MNDEKLYIKINKKDFSFLNMPRRLPVRPAKVFGNFFVLMALSLMTFVWYTFSFVVWGPRAKGNV